MNSIKTMKIKMSKRGITFSFKGDQTAFGVGEHYKYILDVANHKMVILPAEQGNTVSKKRAGSWIKSLFDIRKQDALSAFKAAEYLQVEIFEDQIIIEGFVSDHKACKQKSNVSDIRNLLQVKSIARRIVTVDELRMAAGYPGQISIDDFLGFNQSIQTESGTASETVDIGLYRNLRIPLDIVSCFSGAGILDRAFMDEGFKIIFAIEKDDDACRTYRANIGTHIFNGDICSYPKTSVPDAPVIIGGPPCRPFSKERQDYYSGAIEDHPDSTLFTEYLNWIKDSGDYKVFVLENVPELLKASGGAYLELVNKHLPDFDLSWGIVNDAEQGGYQNRNRAIVIGSKIGKIEIPKPKLTRNQFNTVGIALDQVDESWPNQYDRTTSRSEALERMKYVPQGGNWENIPAHLRTRATHSNAYRRLSLAEPCITLVNYRKPVIIHPEEDRTLSVSEAASLTGLDKNFRFFGNLGSKQQQIGNAVPVAIGRAVAKVIREAISKFNVKTTKLACSI